MRSLLSLLAAFPLTLLAQTTHPVQSGGSTSGATLPFYTPSELTIQVGDIVRWTNVSGTHNVNGTTFTFPGNPEEFYSGQPDNGNWSYQFTFTVPGVYQYHCDSEGHSATQFGTINVVEGTNSIAEQNTASEILAYPTPATDVLMVDVGSRIVTRAEVVGIDGRLVATPAVSGSQVLTIPTADLLSGNYLLRVMESNGTVSTVRFVRK